ncbi:glycosyltransferase family A protein (plasmid) [Salipiger sp. H15]|uniref:Glycosyltransferase family A protein n=1 Tax=Alloyangia sp. H15 TaxID=3029062 RepID=A0AAU8ASB3_9RHOB
MPSFDVVIPNYNYGRYLRACVDSVRSQDVEDLRILIVDNASTDDSPEIARALAAEDPRVELRLRPRNLGPHASFNEGIDWARSDYFLILCSDDMLVPGALRRASAVLEAHPDINLTYGRVSSIAGDLSPLPAENSDASWVPVMGSDLLAGLCHAARNYIGGPSVIVRTSVQKSLGHYSQTLRHADDLEMWLRFATTGNAAFLDCMQAYARRHPYNQSSSVPNVLHWNMEFEAAFVEFFAADGARLSNSDQLRDDALRVLGERAYCSAVTGALRLAPEEIFKLLIYSFQRRKWPAKVFPPIGYILRRAGLMKPRSFASQIVS